MSVSVIQTKNLVKKYGSLSALDAVSFSVSLGSRFVLLGPNGAGKSTLVRILTSLSRADSGCCFIHDLDPGKNTKELMQTIGVVTQENDLDPEENPETLLKFQASLFRMTSAAAKSRCEELIEEFHLEDHRKKPVKELSGGNKRRLHCALALVHNPKVLFLDEPTVGMDPEIRERFWESLGRINREKGMTLFLTTQYLEEADKHADDLALLHEGRILYRGTTADFKKEAGKGNIVSLEEGYLSYVKNIKKEVAYAVN